MLKAVIKHSVGEDTVRHRTIPADVISKWAQKLEGIKEEIAIILKEEKEEKQVRGSRLKYATALCQPEQKLCRSYARQRWSSRRGRI